MIGTLLNTVTVLVGTTLGLVVGDRFPPRARDTALKAVGLVTLLIGFQMALQVESVPIVLASLILGGVLGEILNLELGLDRFVRAVEAKWGQGPAGDAARATVTSSLVFCVGPLTLLGAVQDGLTGDIHLLSVKSLLDGFSSIAFAAALGRGVYLSALVILVYQGSISLLAHLFGTLILDPAHNAAVLNMTAAGGLLIVALGVRLLELGTLPTVNLLPAIVFAPVLTVLLGPWLNRLVLPA